MSGHPKSMRTPLGRVRGFGAARSGTQHFWYQRLTAAALVLLTPMFVIIVTMLLGRNHAATVQILGAPLVAIIMLLFIVSTVYHMWIGMQDIILDYVHDEKWKFAALMGNTFFVVVVGLCCVYAILKMSFGV